MTVEIDSRFPEMDASSAAYPTARTCGGDVILAYHLPGCEDCAVVAFRRVSEWSYDGPNDEGLASHPLWGKGLRFYEFHAITDGSQGASHWLATFHEGVFEIRAEVCEVLDESTKGCHPWQALDSILGPGLNEILDER